MGRWGRVAEKGRKIEGTEKKEEERERKKEKRNCETIKLKAIPCGVKYTFFTPEKTHFTGIRIFEWKMCTWMIIFVPALLVSF